MTGRKRVTEEFMEKVFSAVTLQVVKPSAEEWCKIKGDVKIRAKINDDY